MQILKTLFNKLLLIMICLFLFILYIIIDRKYYKSTWVQETFKMNPNFTLIGYPNDTKYGALAYDDLSISFEDISNNLELKTIAGNESLLDKDIIRLQNTLSNESIEKRVEKLIKKYNS